MSVAKSRPEQKISGPVLRRKRLAKLGRTGEEGLGEVLGGRGGYGGGLGEVVLMDADSGGGWCQA